VPLGQKRREDLGAGRQACRAHSDFFSSLKATLTPTPWLDTVGRAQGCSKGQRVCIFCMKSAFCLCRDSENSCHHRLPACWASWADSLLMQRTPAVCGTLLPLVLVPGFWRLWCCRSPTQSQTCLDS
jgi:hypothetical protein